MKLLYTLPALAFVLGMVGTVTHFTVAHSPNSPQIQQTKNNLSPTQETADNPGGLYVISENREQQVFPLKHTDVRAKIAGNVSRVEVTQTFENPFNDPLEAIYVFPLPDEAAVDEMEIQIGDRIIKGDIKRREEAQQIYEQARQEGRTAALLEQERDNIFTQSLANIKPGEQIKVTIRYTDSLSFSGGDYEFVFPMVVGPRYIPGNPISESGDSDRVPDASRITPPVMRPGTRSGHDIAVSVEIDAGVPVSQVRSPSHEIRTAQNGDRISVQLNPEDTIPNKDLILRYRVAGENQQATVLTEADDRGGHFAVYLIPAIDYNRKEIVPKDVVFLMDTSGSQDGDPLEKSKELMRRFINALNPDDTFTIIDFANTTTQLSATPLSNTRANRQQAMNYIDQLQANGGTELLNGIRAVLNFPSAQEGRLRSIVLLTDGYIGNENEVLAEVQRQLKPGNRLYSFGVGSSVNRFLLDRLGEVGRGTSQIIRQDEPTQEVAERFFQQINNPVLTNIEISWEGSGEAPMIYPKAAPDLFAEQPLVLFGRKSDRANGQLRITGIAAGGDRYSTTLNVNFNQSNQKNAIAQLWGRARIKELMNEMFGMETTSGVEAVTQTALDYRLLSQYTAFVAVTEEVRVSPDGTTQRVEVPVELPEGVSYEGIFGRADEEAADYSGNFSTSTSLQGASVYPLSGGIAPPQAVPAPSSSRNRTPAPPMSEAEPAPPPPLQTSDRIEIIRADNLDATAIASLTQQLNTIQLPPGVNGEVVLELRIRDHRIAQILFNDTESTLEDIPVIDAIKDAIAAWTLPDSLSGTLRLHLRIRS